MPEASKKDVAKCHTFIVKALDNVVCSSLSHQPCLMQLMAHCHIQGHGPACRHHGNRVLRTSPARIIKHLPARRCDARLATYTDTYTSRRLQGGSTVNAADFIPRFSSHLLLNNTDMRVRMPSVPVGSATRRRDLLSRRASGGRLTRRCNGCRTATPCVGSHRWVPPELRLPWLYILPCTCRPLEDRLHSRLHSSSIALEGPSWLTPFLTVIRRPRRWPPSRARKPAAAITAS